MESTEGRAEPAGRLMSLDAFRGLTVAGMILVNNPGSWDGDSIYAPLQHAPWDGWTPTDLVFPFFVFIMGVSIAFALGKRREAGRGVGMILGKVLWRSLVIFGLGLALNAFPFNKPFDTLRIPGVLQRIALCYLFAALIALAFGSRLVAATVAVLLLGYWAALKYVPVPGFPLGDLSRPGNVAAYLDRMILTPAHLYRKEYDPEGLLSTLPAIGTALIGVLVGRWLRSERPAGEKGARLFVVGTFLTVAGLAWSPYLPINKALWTGPFVLLTAGLASYLLGIFYVILDVDGNRGWAWPFVAFGVNPILAFVLSGLGARALGMYHPRSDLPEMDAKDWIYGQIHRAIPDAKDASLAFAVGYVLIWLALMTFLYRKRIIVRV